MLKRVSGVASVLVCLAGCLHLESTAPPEQPQLVVHAVLDASVEQDFVLVYQARTGVASANGNGHDSPVAEALVTVTAPNGAVMIADERDRDSLPFPAGTYAYTPGRYNVRPFQGGTYRLFVRTPSGQVVTGETTMPTAPPMSSPLPPATFYRDRDTLRLSWPRVSGVASYELVIQSHGNMGNDYRVFFDSAVVVPGTALTIAGDPVLPRYAPVTLIVSAVDSNYYNYYRAQSDPFAGTPPSRLTGAVGVFGSIAPLLTTNLEVR